MSKSMGPNPAAIYLRKSTDADGFIEAQPSPTWSLDDNHDWRPPTPQPDGAL